MIWALLGLGSILLLWTIDRDQWIWAGIDIAAILLMLQFFSNIQPLTWIGSHPFETAVLAVSYLAFGVAWSFGKWWFFVSAAARWAKEALDQKRANERERRGVSATNQPQLHSYTLKDLPYNDYYRSFPPNAGEHKGRIIGWIVYWPASALWTLINDPVRRFLEWLFRNLRETFQNMSNSAFRNVE